MGTCVVAVLAGRPLPGEPRQIRGAGKIELRQAALTNLKWLRDFPTVMWRRPDVLAEAADDVAGDLAEQDSPV